MATTMLLSKEEIFLIAFLQTSIWRITKGGSKKGWLLNSTWIKHMTKPIGTSSYD